MEFTRIKNDINGNPRYIIHFLQCEPEHWKNYEFTLSTRYSRVCKLMNKIGGKKFHNKQYGGGIVFQSYNIDDTKNSINNIMKKA